MPADDRAATTSSASSTPAAAAPAPSDGGRDRGDRGDHGVSAAGAALLTFELGPVRLEPLSHAHADGLLEAASGDRSTFGWTRIPSDRTSVETYIEAALRDRDREVAVPFAVRRLADGAVVGSTRLMNIERWDVEPGLARRPDAPPHVRGRTPSSVEIGSTWYAHAAQATAVNPACKLALASHAFEVWGVHRLQLKTDARNARSRAGIESIGARFEGVLRCHYPSFGPQAEATPVRDSAMFSITAEEWPAARDRIAARLEARLAAGH